MIRIDTCGLSCPEPVLRARAAVEQLDDEETIEVLADTVTARENVGRAVRSMGCEVEVCEEKGTFVLRIRKESSTR